MIYYRYAFEPFKCCPVCGEPLIKDSYCNFCMKDITEPFLSKNNVDYYCSEALKRFPKDEAGMFGDKGRLRCYEIFFVEELSRNPLFSHEAFNNRIYKETHINVESKSDVSNPHPFRCCPVCGKSLLDKSFCDWCMQIVDNPIVSDYPVEYYCAEAKKRFPPGEIGFCGGAGQFRGYEIFLTETVSKNPLFDGEKCRKRINEQKAEDARWKANITAKLAQEKANQESSIPKCPTCGSKNIVAISGLKRATHAVMFGVLFSKTAKSQFECKSCGYKW